MSKLKLTVNEAKTWVCQLPEERFDFLGYTFGRCYSFRRKRVFLGTVPSKKRIQRLLHAITEDTGRDTYSMTQDDGGEAQPNADRMEQTTSVSGPSAAPIV